MPLEQMLLLDRMRAIRADNFYGLIIKDALREIERLRAYGAPLPTAKIEELWGQATEQAVHKATLPCFLFARMVEREHGIYGPNAGTKRNPTASGPADK